jgi:hypothetical protein
MPRPTQGYTNPAGKSTPVADAHAHMIERLITNKPHEIRCFLADDRDLDERTAHIQAIGNAFLAYLSEIAEDTVFNANVRVTALRDAREDALNGISDCLSDLVGALANAAEQYREEEADLRGGRRAA